MITEKIRKAIAQRATVNDEWDYGVQQSQKAVSYTHLTLPTIA